jgi:hypothetical protein
VAFGTAARSLATGNVVVWLAGDVSTSGRLPRWRWR